MLGWQRVSSLLTMEPNGSHRPREVSDPFGYTFVPAWYEGTISPPMTLAIGELVLVSGYALWETRHSQ